MVYQMSVSLARNGVGWGVVTISNFALHPLILQQPHLILCNHHTAFNL